VIHTLNPSITTSFYCDGGSSLECTPLHRISMFSSSFWLLQELPDTTLELLFAAYIWVSETPTTPKQQSGHCIYRRWISAPVHGRL
jgi:hypothetical protein